MASQIDRTVPGPGNASTHAVNQNFIIAADEITELQDAMAIGGIPDVPLLPVGQEWVRTRGSWQPLVVDGGTFQVNPRRR